MRGTQQRNGRDTRGQGLRPGAFVSGSGIRHIVPMPPQIQHFEARRAQV
jgi:hypothetical protein